MKFIIFAGGIGTRLWPLSRHNSPKQFDKIFGGYSTLELAVNRLKANFGVADIFIQTTGNFKKIIQAQVKDLPAENIIIEPQRRNVAAAVCLAAKTLQARNYSGPLAILWADHLMARPDEFIQALSQAQSLIEDNGRRFIFFAERPRFANNNLGWLRVGAQAGEARGSVYYSFQGWKYKPEPIECERMFKSSSYFWNPGYYVTSLGFLVEKFKTLAPEIYQAVFAADYSSAPVASFDRAFIEKLDHREAVVLKTNMGWSDPGTLYALKEALANSPDENVVHGQVSNLNSRDCLVYNFEDHKLVTTVGLEGTVVINTKDAIIVVPKNYVKEVTALVKKLENEGLDKFL